jgi:hypothetical protein
MHAWCTWLLLVGQQQLLEPEQTSLTLMWTQMSYVPTVLPWHGLLQAAGSPWQG